MKVLHVWDHCGVSFLIVKELIKQGHHAVVFKQCDSSKRLSLGQDGFYRNFLLCQNNVQPRYRFGPGFLRRLIKKLWRMTNVLRFYLTAKRLARNFDLVHVHSLYWFFFLIPKRKLILHFHGSDIRDSPSLKTAFDRLITRLFLRLFSSQKIFYFSTPDLVNDCPTGIYMHNPVDLDHFTVKSRTFDEKTAVYIENWYAGSCEWAEDMAKNYGLKLTVVNRTKNEHVPYQNFPDYLSNFEYFIDRHVIQSLSKTALEALALGLKVIQWDGKVVESLPVEHYPENVGHNWLKTYRNKLQ